MVEAVISVNFFHVNFGDYFLIKWCECGFNFTSIFDFSRLCLIRSRRKINYCFDLALWSWFICFFFRGMSYVLLQMTSVNAIKRLTSNIYIFVSRSLNFS